MPHTIKVWSLLTGAIRYEKTISTRNRGHGEFIGAPIPAYLIETSNGCILYDVGCNYRKVSDPILRASHFDPTLPLVEPPSMWERQRIPHYLKRLGFGPQDVDVVFISHLHFDHVGGLHDLPGCAVHVQADELAAAHTGADGSVFTDQSASSNQWEIKTAARRYS